MECTELERPALPCQCDYHTAQRELAAAPAGEIVVYGTDGTPWTVEDILRREA